MNDFILENDLNIEGVSWIRSQNDDYVNWLWNMNEADVCGPRYPCDEPTTTTRRPDVTTTRRVSTTTRQPGGSSTRRMTPEPTPPVQAAGALQVSTLLLMMLATALSMYNMRL